MSEMAKEFFANSPALALPVLALVIFVIFFSLVVVRALREAKGQITTLEQLPLQEDRSHE